MKYRGRVISSTVPVANSSQASGIWFPAQHMQGIRAGTWPVLSFAYIGTKLFSTSSQYNNSSSNWIVPANVTFIWFKIWGSGGAPDGYPNGYDGGNGGGGGFTEGVITSTPGETLNVAVGTVTNNGGASKLFGGSGGGFSGVFRSTTPQLIAGGGGGGQVNGTAAGGAGGGSSGQASSDAVTAGGTQSAGGQNGSYLTGGSEGGGGGYYGGGGIAWYYASGGGSGFTGGSIAKTSTTTGNYRIPAGTSDPEYPSGNSPGGLPWAYGGIGNNSGDSSTHGSGYIIAHCYSSNPENLTYPVNRTLL